jgi:ABC-type sugar transport system substrate-binding protein
MSLKTRVAWCGGNRRVGWVLTALAGLILVSGCDSEPFVPPPPTGLGKPPETSLGSLSKNGIDPASSASRPASPPSTARKAGTRRPSGGGTAPIIELLLARSVDGDRSYLVQVLRREAGKAKMVFRLVQPESGTSFSASVLAKEIRAAVGRGASGLIVEPEVDPAVVDALDQAVEQGMSVLLLDRPLATRTGKPIPCIRYGSFPETGREIVQAVLDAAKLFHRPEPARIIFLRHRSTDPYAAVRFNALADPLKAAGKHFSVIEFEGDSVPAAEVLQKSLAADPRLDMVFADDDAGMIASQQVLTEWTKSGHPEFLYAGYLAYDIRTSSEVIRQSAAYGDRSVESFGLKTFQTIQSQLDEKPVGEFVEIPIRVHKKTVVFVPTPAEAEKTPSSSK